ncbi:HAD family hydrolase [Enterococcus ureilyticus]|uniref:HAD family hydrolase n=1 Tax=Enterococcus ureilyticus TaxID=1131292 RepID=A0A1E5HF67_9ENTE|nr:HAD family phosphatase [Enterococcus ureilyticus]MBM7689302.1 HAD superfamily hydrolase (TIGR01509 family) [Enterococcus ureilyticus]MBO0446429.1 HAD family phosphatase [Enterococcus ureilyticus]OEG23573.1 HAD family hydrolase [Enterococcus ureilyticus]
MKKIDGVIFDMDGLLFDTELIYYQSTQKIADAMSFPYSKELYLEFLGVSDEEVQENYHRIYKDFGKEKVNEFINRSYDETYQVFKSGEVPLKEGVLALLDFLDQQEIPRIVASSNVRPAIELLLEGAGIKERFSGIVSAEDVTRAKPDPEIFQKALANLGTKADSTLIFEDSFHGVTAADAAGIPVIMVPDLLAPTDEIKEKTLEILDSLTQVPAYLKK